ncbi:hypothetical protein AcW2_005835 [Taiwanofungus camphoratus]|nr:hypothetical protein AcW2_005835 [Antrodia cinnamomea]
MPVLAPLPNGAFNLRAFHHVRPASPKPSELPLLHPPSALSGVSASSLTPPGARPCAGSFASTSTSPPDSPQRILVAVFWEMAARCSAVNSPSPSSADLAREGASSFGRPTCTSPPAPRLPTRVVDAGPEVQRHDHAVVCCKGALGARAPRTPVARAGPGPTTDLQRPPPTERERAPPGSPPTPKAHIPHPAHPPLGVCMRSRCCQPVACMLARFPAAHLASTLASRERATPHPPHARPSHVPGLQPVLPTTHLANRCLARPGFRAPRICALATAHLLNTEKSQGLRIGEVAPSPERAGSSQTCCTTGRERYPLTLSLPRPLMAVTGRGRWVHPGLILMGALLPASWDRCAEAHKRFKAWCAPRHVRCPCRPSEQAHHSVALESQLATGPAQTKPRPTAPGGACAAIGLRCFPCLVSLGRQSPFFDAIRQNLKVVRGACARGRATCRPSGRTRITWRSSRAAESATRETRNQGAIDFGGERVHAQKGESTAEALCSMLGHAIPSTSMHIREAWGTGTGWHRAYRKRLSTGKLTLYTIFQASSHGQLGSTRAATAAPTLSAVWDLREQPGGGRRPFACGQLGIGVGISVADSRLAAADLGGCVLRDGCTLERRELAIAVVWGPGARGSVTLWPATVCTGAHVAGWAQDTAPLGGSINALDIIRARFGLGLGRGRGCGLQGRLGRVVDGGREAQPHDHTAVGCKGVLGAWASRAPVACACPGAHDAVKLGAVECKQGLPQCVQPGPTAWLPTRSQTAPANMPLLLSTSPTSLASVPSLALPTPPTSPASVSAPAPPSPTTAWKLNGRSLSTLDTSALVGEGIKDLSGPALIVPTPIRKRSPPPAFSVTSCPTLQTQFAGVQGQTPYSLQQQQHQLQAQQQQQQQHQQAQQPTVCMISSPPQLPPSPPALPAGRQPLIPNGGMPPSKGFTGGGLLASATANPTVPSNPPAPTLHATAP